MKQNDIVSSAIRYDSSVHALPKLKAEWNWNRYVGVEARNDPDEMDAGFDPDIFPIESIVEPIRPTKGINKAMVNYALIADDYQQANTPRFYVASEDDKYKYWVSPFASSPVSGANPQIVYERNVWVNKVVVTFENTWASPGEYVIQVTQTGGGNWANAAVNPAIAANGRVTLWWNGAGWQTDEPADISQTVPISGIRVSCTSLTSGRDLNNNVTVARLSNGQVVPTTGEGSLLSVIEMSARLVMDLTDRVINAGSVFDGGEADQVTPVGTITSNVGNVTLWDEDGDFSDEPVNEFYEGLSEPNVEMNLSWVYTRNGTSTEVQEFSMFVDDWRTNEDGTVTVALSDASKYLKETKPLACKYENQSLNQIVYRLCDSIGFTDYVVFDNPRTIDYKIPVFWTDGEKTLWEIFDELAVATQSLIYFDSWGLLRIKTREDAFWSGNTPVWTLRSRSVGTELADIKSMSQEGKYNANLIKVIYKSAKWADDNNGFVEFSTVWEPDGDTVVRSTPLLRSLAAEDTHFFLPPHQASTWPYESMVSIEGELIKFKGKQFRYWNNGWVTRDIVDQSDFDKANSYAPVSIRHLNHFTGRLTIVERGLWNTDTPAVHSVDAWGYDVKRVGPNNIVNSKAGFHHHRQWSIVTMNSHGMLNGPQDFMIATATKGTPWKHMGTKMLFEPSSNPDQRAGIVFNQTTHRDGYYVELSPTRTINPKERKSRNEVTLYAVNGGVVRAPLNGKGARAAIAENVWYSVDIFFDAGSQRVSVWLDGKRIINEHVPGGQQITPNGKFGMFIRGRTACEFEYLYGVAKGGYVEPSSDYSSFHRLAGYDLGRAFDIDWVYKRLPARKKRKNKTRNPTYIKNEQYMDEFGPFVHEVREFDVRFDPAPVQHSKLYSTNDWGAYVLDYRGNSFGAKFFIANVDRENAILNGEDTLLFSGTDASVNQQLLVYGRALVFGEQEEVVVKNEAQIKARGEVVSEISSDWIQTEEAAKAVGEWIKNHWSKGADELTVSIFGNPLYEIGDVVTVDYPRYNMDPATHKYFVVGISNSFDNGLNTSLTLRRAN